MIITCPKCKTQYNVDAELGASHKFRCAICQEIFDAKSLIPSRREKISQIFEAVSERKQEDLDSERYFREIDSSEKGNFGEKNSSNELFNLIVFLILMIFVFLVGFLSVKYFYGNNSYQKISKTYSKISDNLKNVFAPQTNPLSIEIGRDITIANENEGKKLILNGVISNQTPTNQKVGALEIKISNSQGMVIQNEQQFLDFDTLAPSEKRAFTLKITLNSSEEASDVSVKIK